MKDIRIFLKKKKSDNISADIRKMFQKMKKRLLSIEKMLWNEKNALVKL